MIDFLLEIGKNYGLSAMFIIALGTGYWKMSKDNNEKNETREQILRDENSQQINRHSAKEDKFFSSLTEFNATLANFNVTLVDFKTLMAQDLKNINNSTCEIARRQDAQESEMQQIKQYEIQIVQSTDKIQEDLNEVKTDVKIIKEKLK